MDGTNETWYMASNGVSINAAAKLGASGISASGFTLSGQTVALQSDNVLKVTPVAGQVYYLFRRSGANAAGVLGVAGEGGLSASVRSLGGLGGIRTIINNKNNPGNTIETTTDSSGNLELEELIVGDDYTVTIPVQAGVTVEVVTEVQPVFAGQDLGVVTVGTGDQNFKVSYSIAGDPVYLLPDTDYALTIKITNTGSADMLSADYTVSVPAGLSLSGDSLANILGTVQANGGIKELDYTLTVENFIDLEKTFAIPVSVVAVDGSARWDDKISLRVFQQDMSIQVKSATNEVQGVIISPDRESYAFKTTNKVGLIRVPLRDTPYTLALSGANYASETKYSVALGLIPPTDGAELATASINEPNNTETVATDLLAGAKHLGYLGVYDLDFYEVVTLPDWSQRVPVELSPVHGETANLTPTLRWNKVVNATGYEVRWAETEENLVLAIGTSVDSPSLGIVLPSSGASWLWQVRAYNGSNWGPWSHVIDCNFIMRIGEEGQAGGIVFYDKGSFSNGWRYLEAAPSDQSMGISWSNPLRGDIDTGAQATAIGTGQANTIAIVNAMVDGSYAAKLCNDLVLGGYSDWFLPSKDELNAMYTNLKVPGLGGFVNYLYWSSSQDSYVRYAWFQHFLNGAQVSNYRGSQDPYVRAVRAF